MKERDDLVKNKENDLNNLKIEIEKLIKEKEDLIKQKEKEIDDLKKLKDKEKDNLLKNKDKEKNDALKIKDKEKEDLLMVMSLCGNKSNAEKIKNLVLPEIDSIKESNYTTKIFW